MKRRHEDAEEEEPPTSKPRREEGEAGEEADETSILHDLQTHLRKSSGGGEEDLNTCIEKRLFETQKQYFTVYMEKLMHKIPMGAELVKIIQERGSNEFEYTFTAAKSVIQSHMRVKQIKAFHAVFDMVYSLMWRYVHEKVVSPALERHLSGPQLHAAYRQYQSCSQTAEEGPVVALQCLLYCIQEMVESQEPVKIPNPLYSRFTQQMKAMSEYVITILVALSRPGGSEEGQQQEEEVRKEAKTEEAETAGANTEEARGLKRKKSVKSWVKKRKGAAREGVVSSEEERFQWFPGEGGDEGMGSSKIGKVVFSDGRQQNAVEESDSVEPMYRENEGQD